MTMLMCFWVLRNGLVVISGLIMADHQHDGQSWSVLTNIHTRHATRHTHTQIERLSDKVQGLEEGKQELTNHVQKVYESRKALLKAQETASAALEATAALSGSPGVPNSPKQV